MIGILFSERGFGGEEINRKLSNRTFLPVQTGNTQYTLTRNFIINFGNDSCLFRASALPAWLLTQKRLSLEIFCLALNIRP